jgi:dihydrofolate synthase / folylpolyglutamate synthase
VSVPETPAPLREAELYLASLEMFGMRFGLERIRRLMTALGSPQEQFSSIHVVGSNGKSSTTRMIAALLERAGARTGTYTSPHLVSWTERVEVRGNVVSDERFADAIRRAADAAAKVDRTLEPGDRVTQFEALTAAAYWELAQAGVEVAVVEAGLGGRYDATSVIHSDIQVLTNVSLEHTRWLGPTERHIAEEKLAVIPEGGTLVTGPLGPEALEVAERVATERGARLLMLGRDFDILEQVPLRPRGAFQRENFAVAVAAAEAYAGALDPAAVRAAAESVVTPGRVEVVGEAPLTIVDGAHNPAGIAALLPALDALVGDLHPLVAVLSVLDDKDAAGMLAALASRCDGAVFTRSSNPNALPPAVLESLWRQVGGREAEIVSDPATALERARVRAEARGAVLATGSIYLLADLARARARHGGAPR